MHCKATEAELNEAQAVLALASQPSVIQVPASPASSTGGTSLTRSEGAAKVDTEEARVLGWLRHSYKNCLRGLGLHTAMPGCRAPSSFNILRECERERERERERKREKERESEREGE